MQLAPALGLVRREPLPPTVRRRDYVAEILAARGLPSVSVNWWATADQHSGGLHVTGPESIFPSSGGDAIQVDALAKAQLLVDLDHRQPRFAAVYLPALDVVLNRLPLDPSARLAQSLRAYRGNRRHHRDGAGPPLRRHPHRPARRRAAGSCRHRRDPGLEPSSESAWDVVPTLLDFFGFPLSSEMPGHSLIGQAASPRIPTYGDRAQGKAAPLNEEYYENLKSLGYIR